MSNCAYCNERLRQNDHAVQCNECSTWTHRTCYTDISSREYLAAAKTGIPLAFICGDCNYQRALHPESGMRTDEEGNAFFFDSGSIVNSETVDFEGEENSDLSLTESMSDLDVESVQDVELSDIEGRESDTSLAGNDEPADVQENADEEEPARDYEIVPNGSSKGKDLLVDPLGFQYTKKPVRTGTTIYWRCVVRNKQQNCRATIKENDGAFERGKYDHIHEATSGAAVARRIASKVKNLATANVFQSAANIAEEVMVEELSDKPYPSSLATVANVARAANRHRHHMRPKHPVDLKFELQMAHIPNNFLQADIQLGEERHLIFATDCMLLQLQKAKTWYVDGTFKVVQKPFYQLFSFHAFVSKDEIIKQVPLCFVLMSARRVEDYSAVFRIVRKKMVGPPRVRSVVSDFEKALWKAVEKVMPDVKHRGCAFHWTKAIKKQMEANPGIRHQYKRRGYVYRVLREVLALPYLPAENIAPAFETLRLRLESMGLREIANYIQKNWISSKRWSPWAWSVYKQLIRTNNDCEGWHYRLNRKANISNLNLYLLIRLLYNESKMVVITMKMLSDSKLRSSRRKKSRSKDIRIHRYWKQFELGKRTIPDLLRACAYTPRVRDEDAV